MYPAICDGDIVEVKADPEGRWRVGDVVLARMAGRVVAHRIVAVDASRWPAMVTLRGDALASPDGQLPAADILGRVTVVRRSGRRGRLWPVRQLWANLRRHLGYATGRIGKPEPGPPIGWPSGSSSRNRRSSSVTICATRQ